MVEKPLLIVKGILNCAWREKKIIKEETVVLGIGAGNLRHGAFVVSFASIHYETGDRELVT